VVIDLRSDTMTKPPPGMLAAMAAAEVGDEQEREDPTTNELQRRMAELLGHEAALFFPTATMANQAALRALSRSGCKVVAEERTHILIWEWGGPAIHSGLVMQGLVAEAGRPTPSQIEELDAFGPGSVVVLENTHNSSGGRIWPLDEFGTVADAARSRGAALHLDGARLVNAAVAAGLEPAAWGRLADTVAVCFSKGLGCPFGAVLAGSEETIEQAWEAKFLFGGALRQSGVVAAAMLYALDRNVERLADDHVRAKRLAEGIGVDPSTVETNFVPIPSEPDLTERLLERGVAVSDLRAGWLRAVTHLDIGDDEIEQAIERMQEVLSVHA
jgi:threonine aldolase